MTLSERPNTLSQALVEQLVEVVGQDGVLLEREDLEQYRDPYWVPGDDTYAGSAVVCPSSTEEVQAVVRLANEFDVPIWTHSQGRNNGYGGASPRVAGSIQVSLRRMNKVLEINERLAYAVVEPGVRWFDLQEALVAGGHKLMLSVPDLGWGSVIGNSLDNGVTYLPNGANFLAPTGMEVVMPDGDLLRTGMGAVPGNKSWHLYKRGLGPTLDPLFTQSNLGIVTRMGIWLQPMPEAYQTLILTVAAESDLEAAVDTVSRLMLDETIRGVPCFYPAPSHVTVLDDSMFPPQEWDEESLDEFGRQSGFGRWAVRVALWEDRAVLEHKAAKIKAAWSQIDGSTVREGRVYTPDEFDQITNGTEKVQAGIPTLALMETLPDFIGHVGFAPVVPLVGAEIRHVIDSMFAKAGPLGLAPGLGILAINGRSAAVVAAFMFDRTNADMTRKAFDVAKELVRDLGEQGYGEYRAHLDFMDIASDQYSFNDHAYRRFVEKIKDAVDPKGVISPGRHGIWPRRYRVSDEDAQAALGN
jgi:4-cresol dehydrogenase (hydroxylating) flavoprotein subunit